MSAECVSQLKEATDIPSIRAAVLASLPHAADANVQAARRDAERRLARLKRIVQLVNSTTLAPLTPARQSSHDARKTLLALVRLKRELNEPLTIKEAEKVRKACRDDRCATCNTEDPAFQAICVQWFCECLRRRFEERLENDVINLYAIPQALTEALQRFVDNPYSFWLRENELFYDIPRQMSDTLTTVVEPTKGTTHPTIPTRDMGYEFRMYRSHTNSIRKVINQMRACDAGLRP